MATEKPALIVKNKNASRNFKLNESFEAGIALKGWEVKSLRNKKAVSYTHLTLPTTPYV